MKKIYIATNPAPLHNSSSMVSLGKFVRVVCSAGYSPCVVGARLPSDGIPEAPDGLIVKSFPYGGKGLFKFLSYILLQIRSFIWCVLRFDRNSAVYFWIADKMPGVMLAAKLRRAESDFFLYGNTLKEAPRAAGSLMRYFMRSADVLCAESPSVFGEWDIPEGKVLDVLRLYAPVSDPKPYECRPHVVSMMCRLTEGKHTGESIRAFHSIHGRLPEYRLRIIGGGLLEDESRSLVSELGAGDYIEITGWLPHSDATRLLGESRLLLFPTDAEGVPGSVLEAMSLGVPVLASAVGGIPDIIDNGRTGFILPGTDTECIADFLLRVLSLDSLTDVSAAAAKFIRREYSLERAAGFFKESRDMRDFSKG